MASASEKTLFRLAHPLRIEIESPQVVERGGQVRQMGVRVSRGELATNGERFLEALRLGEAVGVDRDFPGCRAWPQIRADRRPGSPGRARDRILERLLVDLTPPRPSAARRGVEKSQVVERQRDIGPGGRRVRLLQARGE